MAGIIDQAAGDPSVTATENADQAEVSQENTQPQEPAQGGTVPISQKEVSAEEQEKFTRYEMSIKRILHQSPEQFDKVVEMLKNGAENPPQVLAQTALMLFSVLDEAIEQGVEEDMIFPTAEVALDYVIDVAEKLNIFKVSEDLATEALKQLIKQAGAMYGFDTEGLDESFAQSMQNATYSEDKNAPKDEAMTEEAALEPDQEVAVENEAEIPPGEV